MSSFEPGSKYIVLDAGGNYILYGFRNTASYMYEYFAEYNRYLSFLFSIVRIIVHPCDIVCIRLLICIAMTKSDFSLAKPSRP